MAVPCSLVLLNVKTLLNDAGMIHWTQNELLQWGSEGQVELVVLKPDAATKTVTHQLVSGAKQTNPDDCIEIIDMRQNDEQTQPEQHRQEKQDKGPAEFDP